MNFEITILGSSSAIPAFGRSHTAQVLNIDEKLYLIDCGESTQIQLSRYKIKRSRINHIFISHLHGDHFFGLFGLITSYHLLGRSYPLHLFGPPQLIEIINLQLESSNTKLNYELVFHAVDPFKPQIIFDNNDITVETLIMQHSIPCTGFLFKEKKQGRKVVKGMLEKYEIPYSFVPELREGKDYTDINDQVIKNDILTTNPVKTRSYAYCSDTSYNEMIIPQIKNIDLLFHEATFAKDSEKRATETCHSTAIQAANMAKKTDAKQLIIGHFSAKYKDVSILLKEAKTVFKNTILGAEGEKIAVETD